MKIDGHGFKEQKGSVSSEQKSNSYSRRDSMSGKSSGGASSGSLGNQSQLLKVLKSTSVSKSRVGGMNNKRRNIKP